MIGNWLFVFWLMTAPGKWEQYKYIASSYHNCWHVESMFKNFGKEYPRYSARNLYYLREIIHSPTMYLGCTKIVLG